MNRRHGFLPLWVCCCLLLLAACDTGRAADDEQFRPRPAASASYLSFYGPAPVAPQGSYQALVGFLPRMDAPGKVSPFPVFQVASQDSALRLLQRLISADADLARRYELINPFPPGTRVLSIRQSDDVVNIDLSRQVLRQPDLALRRSMVLALGHTLVQFPGIHKVVVSVDGIPLSGPNGHFFLPSPLDVVVQGAPRIVGVAALWDRGADRPASIAIYFDRPIIVKDLLLTDDQGRVLDGHLAQENFDMALVLHPNTTLPLAEGMRVRVLWQVFDPLGGASSGERIFHPQRVDRS